MTAPPRSLKELFLAALDVAPEGRAAWLDRACAADAGLHEHLRLMLAAHDAPQSLLDQPGGAFLVPGARQARDHAVDRPVTEGPGTVVGPYKLLEQIGEGGFGIVFMAEQTQPVRRRVALKVLKPGMDTRQVVARFEAERQALALMDHPHIARILDGGETATGRPFFVMDLVRGVPVTEYCDENQLTPRERLGLFVDVCRAVQHAHQKGVIHRDLKPSNVLVSRHDGTPVVKVIDFGIAKAVGQRLTDKTLFTNFAQLVGTPLYMSPEQADTSDLDVDTRSDIYSLGVLLYELLTGTTPFDKDRLKEAGYDDLRRIIREEEPPRPSTRVSTLGQAATTISANRRSDPRRLSHQLHGELDWIVMKALEKDRNRRYESAGAFAADVRRYLGGEAVQACPPSAAYRFRKFARRNKAAVATVAGLALVAAAATTAAVQIAAARDEARASAEQQRQARQAADAAKEKAEKALGVARRALDRIYLRVAETRFPRDPQREREDAELLAQAIQFFEELAEQNPADVEMRQKAVRAWSRVATIHSRLGQPKAAEADFRRGLALAERLAADFPDRPTGLIELAAGDAGLGFLLMCSAARPADAEQAFRRILARSANGAAQFPGELPFRHFAAIGSSNLGRVLYASGRYPDAEQAQRRGLALWQELTATEATYQALYRFGTANSHKDLADVFVSSGRLPEAEAAYRRAVAIGEKLVAEFPLAKDFLLPRPADEDENSQTGVVNRGTLDGTPAYHSVLAGMHHSLGLLLQSTSRRAEAEQSYRRALAVQEPLAGDFRGEPDHRRLLAAIHGSLGTLLWHAGRRGEAAAAYRRARDIMEKLASNFPDVPVYPLVLAGFLANCPDPQFRDPPRAVALAKKCTAAAPEYGFSWRALGIASHRAGDNKAAAAALERAVQLRAGGDATDWFFLAMAHGRLGEKDRARRWYEQAVTWTEKNRPGDEELRRFRTEAAQVLGVEAK